MCYNKQSAKKNMFALKDAAVDVQEPPGQKTNPILLINSNYKRTLHPFI